MRRADITVTAFQTGRRVQLHATVAWPGEPPPSRIWHGISGTLDDDGVLDRP